MCWMFSIFSVIVKHFVLKVFVSKVFLLVMVVVVVVSVCQCLIKEADV